MGITCENFGLGRFIFLIIFLACEFNSIAQTRKLVWSDDFAGTLIDRSKWKFGSGTTNDNVHYYTDRAENAKIVDGKLQIISLKESYKGLSYTSALLETSTSMNWKYGRVEARIKLPATRGFVPAFWMLPADNLYGFWPMSGEMDIMEYPTTQGKTIYGTVHTNAYNLFYGATPPGGTVQISDAESAFHLYAIEWTPNQVDFYVDNLKYFTFYNDHKGFKTWPFSQPFYVILNLAVGGSWVGSPDATTIFPAIMEIDYVRVYQYENDMAVTGPDFLPYNSQSVPYSYPVVGGASYSWTFPGNATILSGQNTSAVIANWNIFGGKITTQVKTNTGNYALEYPVDVSFNLMKNSGFEKGVKYWNSTVSSPASADYLLDTLNFYRGKTSLMVNVKHAGTNAWDAQLAQRDLPITNKIQYKVSFRAKTSGASGQLNAAIIRTTDNAVYSVKTFQITNSWTMFELNFTATVTAVVSFNIDFGAVVGKYFLDDFVFTTPELFNYNQIENADFEKRADDWLFTVLPPAQAIGAANNGEYLISMGNGGVNVWDVHLGQSNILSEKGKEYTVSFDASASAPRTISVFVGKNSDPWTVYSGSHIYSLTTAKKTYSFSFVMNEATDGQARFGFDAGASSPDVFIDNVFLSEGKKSTGTNTYIQSKPESFKLYQNFPNPFNPVTTIKYHLEKSSKITLKIFDSTGNEIKTLVDGFQESGEHLVEWNAVGMADGIYFSKLIAPDCSETIKIIICKLR